MQVETPVSPRRLSVLKAEMAHARDRFTLYRAKCYGPTRTSPGKLQELKRNSILAKRRFERAQADAGE